MLGEEEAGVPESTTAAPTADEDQNLVELLRADARKERFYLPVGGANLSEDYFIELKGWTGSERDQYLSAGTRYETRATRRAEPGGRLVSTAVNAVEAFRVMVRLSITDFRLPRGKHEVVFRDEAQNWAVFRDLPPAVTDWVRDTIRRFQGIEMETAEGEA